MKKTDEKVTLPTVQRHQRDLIQRSTSVSKIPSTILFNEDGDELVKLKMCGKMVNLCLEYCEKKAFDEVLIVLDAIESKGISTDVWDVHVDYIKSYITILIELKEYVKSVEVCKRMVDRCARKEDLVTLLHIFDLMGKSLVRIKEYKAALSASYMVLKIALRLFDYRSELEAYEKIGVCYFNMNELDKAEYFHRKNIEGKYEPDDSMIRKKSIFKQVSYTNDVLVKNRFITEVIDEDIQELEGTFFEPMAVDPKYRGLSEKKRLNIELMDRLSNRRRIGHVQVYSTDARLENIERMGLIKRPTNYPLSHLAFQSSNRGITALDAISARDKAANSGFRFVRYGRDLSKDTKLIVEELLKKMLAQFDHSKRRIKRRRPEFFSIHLA